MTLAEDAVLQEYQENGFHRVVVRRDEPNISYPLHYHEYDLAVQVMEGWLTMSVNHHRTKLEPGQRALIPTHAFHTVEIGSQGCVFIHAEKAPK